MATTSLPQGMTLSAPDVEGNVVTWTIGATDDDGYVFVTTHDPLIVWEARSMWLSADEVVADFLRTINAGRANRYDESDW